PGPVPTWEPPLGVALVPPPVVAFLGTLVLDPASDSRSSSFSSSGSSSAASTSAGRTASTSSSGEGGSDGGSCDGAPSSRERSSGIAEKENVDPLAARDGAKTRDLVERALGVDVEQDERRRLHRDARDEQRERHVDDRVPLLAQRRRKPIGFRGWVAHEDGGRPRDVVLGR